MLLTCVVGCLCFLFSFLLGGMCILGMLCDWFVNLVLLVVCLFALVVAYVLCLCFVVVCDCVLLLSVCLFAMSCLLFRVGFCVRLGYCVCVVLS